MMKTFVRSVLVCTTIGVFRASLTSVRTFHMFLRTLFSGLAFLLHDPWTAPFETLDHYPANHASEVINVTLRSFSISQPAFPTASWILSVQML